MKAVHFLPLALRDGRSPAAMGITDENIKTFQLYGPPGTTRRHLVTLALEALPKVKGRGRIIQQVNARKTLRCRRRRIDGCRLEANPRRLPLTLKFLTMHRQTSLLFAALLVASCSAPISYQKISCRTPAGDYAVAPLSDALRELEVAKAEPGPVAASGHLFESARLAGKKALAGEPGALGLYNQAVGLLVERLGDAKSLPWGRSMSIGSGAASYTLCGKLEPGAPTVERRYVNVEGLKFRGVYSGVCATRPGVGTPLIAISPENKDSRRTYESPQTRMYSGLMQDPDSCAI